MVFDFVGGAHSAIVLRVRGDDFVEARRIARRRVDVPCDNTRGTAEQPRYLFRTATAANQNRADGAAAGALRHKIPTSTQPDPERHRRAAVTQVMSGTAYTIGPALPVELQPDPEAIGNSPIGAGGSRIRLRDRSRRFRRRMATGTITRTAAVGNLTLRIDAGPTETLVFHLQEK